MPRKKASSEDDAFLQMIVENPDDDTPRLIYADWLEERGDPRGEFIRLQCQRAAITRHHAEWKDIMDREIKLLKQYGDLWLGGAHGLHFRRGLVEEIEISAALLLRETATASLFRKFPTIRRMRISLLEDHLPALARAPWLHRIEYLDLSWNELGRRPLEALLRTPHCQSLKSLKLESCGLNSASVACFAETPLLKNLRELDVSKNSLGEDGVRILVHANALTNLRRLNLAENYLTADAAKTLTDAPRFRLHGLTLGSTYDSGESGLNSLGNDGAATLAKCMQLGELTSLDLGHNQISNVGVRALAASPNLSNLEELKLNNNRISDHGLEIIASSSTFAKLVHLDVNYNEFSQAAVEALTAKRPDLRFSAVGAR
jgi:uncharacterized protein (TIGR02996 family)